MLIPEQYGQVNWQFTGIGSPNGAEVTMGFGHGDFAGTIGDAAEALSGAFADTILTVMADGSTLSNTHVKYGPNDIGPFADFPSNIDGGLSVAQTTPQIAVLITKSTANGGRSGRGRMYVPAATETDTLPDGTLDGPYRTAWQTEADNLLEAMSDLQLGAELLHGEDSPAPFPYTITALVVSSRCATQRRRNRS